MLKLSLLSDAAASVLTVLLCASMFACCLQGEYALSNYTQVRGSSQQAQQVLAAAARTACIENCKYIRKLRCLPVVQFRACSANQRPVIC